MKRALVLIDFIHDRFSSKGALYAGAGGRKIIPFSVSVLDKFREKREIVVFISDAHQSGDRELKILPKHSMRGTAGAQVIEEMTPLPGEDQITKRCYSGVFSTPVADVLKRNYITEVHLLGATTSVEIMETAAGLYYHGFNIVLYKKGITDLKASDSTSALKRMQKIFNAKVI